jgi:hypothetical protein
MPVIVQVTEVIINQDSIKEIEKMKADSLKNLVLILEKKRRDSVQFSLKKIQYPDNKRSLIFPFF